MNNNLDDNIVETAYQTPENQGDNESISSRPSSPASSTSSSPSSSSDGSSSSSELNPKDALQSPLTGLLNFEGFSMPQIRNFGISNIDMPNLPSLPNLSFNMPSFQGRFPENLAQNLSNNFQNLQNFTTNMPNFPNLSYLSQLRNVNTASELQNLFNQFRISANLPTLPNLRTLPNLPTLPQLPQITPLLGQFLSRGQLLKPRTGLCESVKNMHLRLREITQRLPNSFHLREWKSKSGLDYIRIYFLMNGNLYFCDTLIGDSNLRYKVSNKNMNGNQLRNEILNTQPLHPQIILDHHIDSIEHFEHGPNFSRFVFCNQNNLYYVDDFLGKNSPRDITRPSKIETDCPHVKVDLKFCPSNPDLVAYLCNGDIWCANLKTGQEMRLTNLVHYTDRVESISQYSNLETMFDSCGSLDASPVIIGQPSYIIKEEFRRNQGFWWRPDTDYLFMNGSCAFAEYQILFEETDQSNVSLVIIPFSNGSLEGQRFPKPGGINPTSRLKLIKFRVSTSNSSISDVKVLDLITDLRNIYPECEYLARVGWLGRDAIWVQLLNRRQTRLALALISVPGTFRSQVIHEETNDIYWVRTHDILHFFNVRELNSNPLKKGSEISFLWLSEESGFRHLYLIKARLGDDERISPRIIYKKQLTEGNWEVSDKDLWVDEKNMLIYFCGLRDSPLEKHLYVLSYAECFETSTHSQNTKHNHLHSRNRVHRLTELNFTQSTIAFDASRSFYVNIQSNISVPPFGFVNRIVPHESRSQRSRRSPDSKRIAILLVNSFIYPSHDSSQMDQMNLPAGRPSVTHECQADLLPGLGKPELFCCQLASGELIYGSIFKPEFMESGVRYPTVLEIYGGPEVQLVSNSFMDLRQPARHLLSSEGYVVVLIDCRGSSRRGMTFEAHAFHRMGQVEMADQVEVINWLAKNTDYIDLNRVAIKGWSYGGYMALMALIQYPEVFKIAIAGAPLVDWYQYDSAYSERFMGLPDENEESYQKANILNQVNLFPDQENRLLLFHGMRDENVHFSTHTVALIQALIKAGKPYDLQIYPDERHVLSKTTSCESYMTCVLSYLQLNL